MAFSPKLYLSRCFLFGSPDGCTEVVGALYFTEAGAKGFFEGLLDDENKLLKLKQVFSFSTVFKFPQQNVSTCLEERTRQSVCSLYKSGQHGSGRCSCLHGEGTFGLRVESVHFTLKFFILKSLHFVHIYISTQKK